MACSLELSSVHTVGSVHAQSYCLQTYKLLHRHGLHLKHVSLKIGLGKKNTYWEDTFKVIFLVLVECFWEPAALPRQDSAANTHGVEGAGWLSLVKLIWAVLVFGWGFPARV